MAIGSGQLLGKGLGNEAFDSVKNGNYISEPHTDFIFAVAGEELGFIGSVIIIALIFFITIEILLIAKRAKDIAGKILELYDDEIKKCYDFEYILIKKEKLDEEGNDTAFTVVGTKHPEKDGVSWTRN